MTDFTELRRRANENLKLTPAQRRKRDRDLRAARVAEEVARLTARRDEKRAARDTLARLRGEFDDLDAAEADIRADSFYTSDAGRLQGALEEIDSMRDSLATRIHKLDCRLYCLA